MKNSPADSCFSTAKRLENLLEVVKDSAFSNHIADFYDQFARSLPGEGILYFGLKGLHPHIQRVIPEAFEGY